MAALTKVAPSRMTLDEFIDWPGDGSGRKHQLVEGEPVAMAPASVTHGIIQANVASILRTHLRGTGCFVVVEPGIIPRVRSEANMRVPDLAVSCDADDRALRALTGPKIVIEILSPSNEAETRENVWVYTTIPSVSEILLIRSTRIAAELISRGADGSWPANPRLVDADAALVIESLDFSCPLTEVYEDTNLVPATGAN